MSGVSLLKGSGNFHSRVLLKLPQFTFLKPVLANLLQNPNFVLIPPSLPPPFLIHPVLTCPFWILTRPFIVEVSVEPDFFYLWVSVGDVINKAESYSTANQHLLVKKLLLVILMITIIVNMVSFFFYNAYMNCSLGKKRLIRRESVWIRFLFSFSYCSESRSCSSCYNFRQPQGGALNQPLIQPHCSNNILISLLFFVFLTLFLSFSTLSIPVLSN